MTATILVVDDSEVVLKLVQWELKDAGYRVATAQDGRAGLKVAKQVNPDLIILDVQMPEMDGYEVCRQLRKTSTTIHVPIIMLTSLSNLSNMQEGYAAGADDYITKPFKSLELRMRVESLLRRARLSNEPDFTEPISQVIAIFSLRGGAGCTSLATNLAVGLSQMWGSSPALLDLALPTGACDILLDLKPVYNLSALVHHEISDFDEDLINEHLTLHSSGLKVMSGIVNPADSELVNENMVSLLLDHIQRLAPYVLIDTSHDFSPSTLAALDAATRILMPITPDIISLREAKSALNIFQSLGYLHDKIDIIVNWTFPQNGIDRPAIEKALGRPVLSVIPFTPGLWSKAINMGQPVILDNPASPLTMKLENMVWYLSTEVDHASKRSDRSEMWKRVAKRRWKKRADETEMIPGKK
ncbi:MAG: response regulator [Chloroflexota bacterium]